MITFVSLADIPGLAAQTFDELAEAGVVVDMIVQSIGRENRADISVTIKRSELEKSLAVAKDIAKSLGCPVPTFAAKVAKLSVFGTGIKSHSGVASRMFRRFAESQINLELISTSEVRINVVVDGARGAKALAALKKEFADGAGVGQRRLIALRNVGRARLLPSRTKCEISVHCHGSAGASPSQDRASSICRSFYPAMSSFRSASRVFPFVSGRKTRIPNAPIKQMPA